MKEILKPLIAVIVIIALSFLSSILAAAIIRIPIIGKLLSPIIIMLGIICTFLRKIIIVGAIIIVLFRLTKKLLARNKKMQVSQNENTVVITSDSCTYNDNVVETVDSSSNLKKIEGFRAE